MKQINPLMSFLMAKAGIPVPYNNGGGWKVENGAVVLQDGNPVFVGADGKESIVDQTTIARLNAEAKSHRIAKEAAETKLKDFEGLDAKAARDALEKIGKIDAKTLIDAGEVDKVRNTIKSEYEGQIAERDGTIKGLNERISGLLLDMAFKDSDFIRDNIAVPADMFRAAFGKHFKVENEQIVAFGNDGNRVLSKKRIGEPADFAEAIEILVDSYPNRDAILKAPDQRGTGGNGNGGQRGNVARMSRDEFAKLSPQKQAEFSKAVREGKAELH